MTHVSASQSTKTDSCSIVTTAGLQEEALAALIERGLDIELAVKLGWRSSKNATAGNAEIEIPYYSGDKEVNVKTRTLLGEKRFKQVKDAVKCFYNSDVIDEWQRNGGILVICEGEMDCLAALQCGFMAVSVPDGAPANRVMTEGSKYSYLDGFPKDGLVVICADNDNAGANLLNDIGLRLGRHRCKWIQYPSDCKDLNDILMKHGTQKLQNTIFDARWLKVDGVYKMSELPPIAAPDSKNCKIIPINIRKRDFSVWTGIPSHGKSTFMNQIAFNLAEQGWNICFASFEQTPQIEHRYNLRTLTLGMSARMASAQELDHADSWIDEHFGFIVPPKHMEEDAGLGWLLEKMAASCLRHDIDAIIIDPWNEMEHSFDRREMSMTDYTGFAIRQLKKFADKYNVHVAVVAHPAKMRRDQKTQKYPMPTLYDIADSAHWANKPDLGVVVHRDEDSTVIKVQKSRYHEDIGRPDEYPLNYDDSTKRYSKLGPVYSLA